MQGTLVINVREELEEHHRRCLPALARLCLVTRAEDGELLSPFASGGMEQAMREVLAELRMAEKTLIDSLAGTTRQVSVADFLTCRLNRLALASDDIREAAVAGDVPDLRRRLHHFHALTFATLEVQLGVVGRTRRSPLTSADGHRPPRRPLRAGGSRCR